MAEQAIYLDTSQCTGCKGCQVACKCWNLLPSPLGLNANKPTGSYQSPADLNGDTRLIVTFNETDTDKKWGVNWSIGRRSCMHCINPACAAVCSSGALSVDPDTGFVAVDESKCIGCEYCSAACPFDVPRFFGAQNKVNKCTACLDRIQNGKQPSINDGTGEAEMQFNKPACVHTCPAGALDFGPREEMIAKAYTRVDFLRDHELFPSPDASVYGVDELEGLHVISVLKYPVETYGLPADPRVNPLTRVLDWAKPLTGLAAGATVLGLGFAFLRGVGYKRHELHYDPAKHETIDVDTGEVVWKQDSAGNTEATKATDTATDNGDKGGEH